MKTFSVEITETLQKTIEVKASTREEAETIAYNQWRSSEHVLDSDNFTGVECKVIPNVRVKNIEMER